MLAFVALNGGETKPEWLANWDDKEFKKIAGKTRGIIACSNNVNEERSIAIMERLFELSPVEGINKVTSKDPEEYKKVVQEALDKVELQQT